MAMKVRTTVIGSYPVVGDGFDAIRAAVQDQLDAGIDLISDGQTRKDMVAYFADHIPGFEVNDGRSYIVGKIMPPEEAPLPVDLAFARRLSDGRADVKAIITGPVTMAFFSELKPSAPYKSYRDQALYQDISNALVAECQLIQKEGFMNFQIDEPSFSIGAPMDLGRKALENIFNGIRGTKALHVCGSLRGVFQSMVQIDGMDVISIAFKDSLSNFDNVERKALEDHGKKLGIGCVSSTDGNVESKEAISSIIRKAAGAYGVENISSIHPDCGLRSLERETAKGKLRNMVMALKGMAKELE
uniref:Cobalamin-independent methionine synthase MetE C-terminal/archaeal domain-containing protein n=1 Tax=Candidatus Methanomethylicus mesodigestus TaxID=1867258 RepID=A0A7C3J535_9CREN